jgi:hypothetical protein
MEPNPGQFPSCGKNRSRQTGEPSERLTLYEQSSAEI